MKNRPKRIYLQVGNDCQSDADFSGLSGVSWCNEKIHNNDIEYVRTDLATEPDWEQRRYEIAKDIYAANEMVNAVGAVACADELIAELQKQKP